MSIYYVDISAGKIPVQLLGFKHQTNLAVSMHVIFIILTAEKNIFKVFLHGSCMLRRSRRC
jgi:hypothetical protein